MYKGFEIDMLSLGDADCILVTWWENDGPVRVLIDGGNTGAVKVIRQFLQAREVRYIHHVICSHPHNDHAGGLLELARDKSITFGKAWLHKPTNHVDMLAVEGALSKSSFLKEAHLFRESMETSTALEEAFLDRLIDVEEPFQGDRIAGFVVCGPSYSFYKEILAQYTDPDKISRFEQVRSQADTEVEVEELIEDVVGKSYLERSTTLDESPETHPENNTSVVLWTRYEDEQYVFTADAGTAALGHAIAEYDLSGCTWMQIPHHGSRRNINTTLIKYFSPKTAFVSAAGNRKHPRRAVVNAFKETGVKVFSTHYPNGGHLWHHRGIVPERPDYGPATPLWEADK